MREKKDENRIFLCGERKEMEEIRKKETGVKFFSVEKKGDVRDNRERRQR